MDNTARYGFRWLRGNASGPKPPIVECFLATGASFDVSGGAQNVRLRAGDPVLRGNGGDVNLANGTENAGTAAAAFGIIAGFKPYWNGTTMLFEDSLPSDQVYGSVLERQLKILVIPLAPGMQFEIDVDDIVTATTEAGYQAFIGENCQHQLTGAVGAAHAFPKLDISTHANTATFPWRIVGISKTFENIDFSGANVKLIVEANAAQHPFVNTTGTS